MARGKEHSKNWGGPRPGAGTKKAHDPNAIKRAVEQRQTEKKPDPLLAAAAMAAAAEAIRARAAPKPQQNPFAIPKRMHPPSVMPAERMQIAMDSAVDWAAGQWSAGDGYGLAAEGLAFLGYPTLSQLAQRAEYRTFAETTADECTRKWIELKSRSAEEAKSDPQGEAGAEEQVNAEDRAPLPGQEGAEPQQKAKPSDKDKSGRIKELNDFLDMLEVRDRYHDMVLGDGQFGRMHLFHNFGADLTNGDGELASPIGKGRDELSKGKIAPGSLKSLKCIEPVWTYPLTYNAINPLREDFYNPQHWYVQGTEIHESRLLTMVGRPVPDLLKPAYSFGGISLTQLAKSYVDLWLTTRQSVADLIHSFSTMVLMADLSNILSPGGASQLINRLDLFMACRDNNGAFVVDKNTEDFKNVSAPISGLEGLQAQSQEHMMSVARIPAVKFTGIQPAGLSSTSEGELRAFYDTINGFQQKRIRPLLQRTIWYAMLSLWGEVDEDIVFDFLPLYELTAKEKADLRKSDGDRGVAYINAAVISPEEERKRLASDPESGYHGLDPEDVPEPPDMGEEEGGAEPFGGGKDKGSAAAEDAVIPFLASDEWHEADHPRGQPGNAGQFGSGGGGSSSKGGEHAGKGTSELIAEGVVGTLDTIAKNLGYGGWGKLNGSQQMEVIQTQQAQIDKAKGHAPLPEPKADSAIAALKKTFAPGLLDFETLKKIAPKKGSNEGGVYQAPEGAKYYVKTPKSAAHVKNELAAATLYNLAGAGTLKYKGVKDGKHVATRMTDLDKLNAKDLSPAEKKEAQSNLAVHAWLANWDAIGTGGDNQGVVDGKATTLDVGGALEYRAQGEPKGKAFGNVVDEMVAMTDSKIEAGQFFGDMSDQDQIASIEKVTSLSDQEIIDTVKGVGGSDELAKKLIARKDNLADQAAAIDPQWAKDHPRGPDGRYIKGAGGQEEVKAETLAPAASDPPGLGKAKKSAFGGLWKEGGDNPAANFQVNAASVLSKATNAGQSYRQMLAFMIKEAAKHGHAGLIPSLKSKLAHAFHLAGEKLVTQGKAAEGEKDKVALGQQAAKAFDKAKELGWYAGAGAAAPEVGKPVPTSPAPAPKPAPAPTPAPAKAAPAPKFPAPTSAELDKAKKNAALQPQYLGVPEGQNEPEVLKMLQDFNAKYSGKDLAGNQAALVQKVNDFKTIQAKAKELGAAAVEKTKAEQAKVQAEAKAKEAKEKKEAAAAMEELSKSLGVESAADVEAFQGLTQMMGWKNPKDAVAAFKKLQDQAGSKGYGPLNGFEFAIVQSYTGSAYYAVNKALREGSWTAQQHLYVNTVNKALKKLPKYQGGPTHRGASLTAQVQGLYKVGHIVEERAFTSTAKSPGSAFGGNTKYVVTGKSGIDVQKLSHYNSEQEVLYPARSFFRVTKVEGSAGSQMVVHMEEVEAH